MAHSASATQSAWKAESGAVYSRLKWPSARRETFNTAFLSRLSRLAAHATVRVREVHCCRGPRRGCNGWHLVNESSRLLALLLSTGSIASNCIMCLRSVLLLKRSNNESAGACAASPCVCVGCVRARALCGVELGRAPQSLPAPTRGPGNVALRPTTAAACTRNCATVRSACTRGMMTRSFAPVSFAVGGMSTAPSSRGTPYL